MSIVFFITKACQLKPLANTFKSEFIRVISRRLINLTEIQVNYMKPSSEFEGFKFCLAI